MLGGEEKEGSSGEANKQGTECEPSDNECMICFQAFTFRTQLPDCGHVFCFLCIKGVALRRGTCPLCRRPISLEIFRDPKLAEPYDEPTATRNIETEETKEVSAAVADEKAGEEEKEEPGHWYYEARRGGWWRYEPRQEALIEAAFLAGEESISLLIAGFMYCIDFLSMCQYRKDMDRAARWERAIKRTLVSDSVAELGGAVKGIAGLRTVPAVAHAAGKNAPNEKH